MSKMELICSAALGFGCRKSIDYHFDSVWTAAFLSSVTVQMGICRFYEACRKEIPTDLLHISVMSSSKVSSVSLEFLGLSHVYELPGEAWTVRQHGDDEE